MTHKLKRFWYKLQAAFTPPPSPPTRKEREAGRKEAIKRAVNYINARRP